jgi:uncharacterized protein (TIGR02757 family)
MQRLEAAYDEAPWDEWVAGDPLGQVRRFDDPRDREAAGFVAASLAYGRVGSICSAVERVLAAMEYRPHEFLASRGWRDVDRFAGCSHRFHTPAAIVATLRAAGVAIERHGSLRDTFLLGWSPRQSDTTEALASFVDRLRQYAGPLDDPALYATRHFLASPADGSACKRLNLFLRWMVRTGPPDCGAWPEIEPSALLIPVDVHVARIARTLGWTARVTPGLAMSREVTETLRRLDPRDPTRFDFVISHLGMDGLAGRLRPKSSLPS